MNTAGGFILEAEHSKVDAGPSTGQLKRDDRDVSDHDSISVRKLTAKQEIRLMNYLDDAFMEVNRGYNKRHNIKTSSVPDIHSYLRAYEIILALIASIPSIGPSASLLVSYLLRYTNEILDGIAGYEIGSIEDPSSSADVLGQELQMTVDSLNLLDRVWSCVLRGQMVDINAVKRNIERAKDESDDLFPLAGFSRQGQEAQNGSMGDANQESGRYPPEQPNKSEKEGKSIVGSKGFATVAQTHRIRLRNLVALGKENLFTWMRVQLDVPLPPKLDAEKDDDLDVATSRPEATVDEDAEATNMASGAVTVMKKEDDDDDDEEGEELEEVVTNGRLAEANDGDLQPKHDSHYDDLFARKIDPDASDVEDDEDSDTCPKQNGNGKHHINSSPEERIATSTKRSRRGLPTTRETTSTSPLEDAESVATFSGTATVMRWDIKFARLFSHTLRCLSDIQEYSNQRDSHRQEADETS